MNFSPQEIALIYKVLRQVEYVREAFPAMSPVMDKLEKMAECEHLLWTTGLTEVSTCKTCGVKT